MNVSRWKSAIFFSFSNVFETKNVSLNYRQSAESDNLKVSEKNSNLPKTGKIAEVFFQRLIFHLMRQSKMKVKANRQL